MENSHGIYIDGPNRNRWFTELENGGSFHGELLVRSRWYPLVNVYITMENHPSNQYL